MRLSATSSIKACRYLSSTSASCIAFSHSPLIRLNHDSRAPLPSRHQTRNFTSSPTATMSDSFFDAIKSRRTYYALSDESPISDKKIHEIVNTAIKHVPSSFNSQSTRVVVLLNEEHKKLWGDIVMPAIKAVAPPEAWPGSEKKLNGFKAAYGTILFYEEPKDVAKLQEDFPLYADKFPQWSEHTNAMHQIVCEFLCLCPFHFVLTNMR